MTTRRGAQSAVAGGEAGGMTAEQAPGHHPDCPVNFFTDMPWRCRCIHMVMLDRRRAESLRRTSPDQADPS